MATKVTMPQMGFDMTEGKVARWLKQVGDPVKHGEAVVEIETDKVNIESEAQADGVLREILVSEGSTVPVGSMIGIIGAPGEDLAALKAEAGPVAAAASGGSPAAPASAPQAFTSSVTPDSAPGPAQPQPAAVKPLAERAEVATAPAGPAAPVSAGGPISAGGNGRLKASPLARRLAQEKGVDLKQVIGSGPGGRIVRRDIEAARTSVSAAPAEPIAAAPAPAGLGPSRLKAETLTPTKLRQTIAKRMTASKQTVPHFYVTVEVDMAEALALRAKLNTLVDEAGKISVNDMIVKAAALALTRFPAINASYAENAVVRHGTVNMGIAVALEQGLITVVVNDTDRKPLAQIAREARDIATRAKTGKARPEELQGSTFTISNLGMFGEVDSFVAIINPPEAAILAVGTVREVPIVKDGQVVPGKTLKVTLSADHRVTDGAEAAKFLAEVKQYLEEPLRLLV